MKRNFIVAAMVTALVLPISVGVGFDALALAKPQIACMNSAAGEWRFGVLVIGESWASSDHLLPALPIALSRRTGLPVRICTMSFSGKNSRKIYRGAKSEFAAIPIERLFEGRAPEGVIVLSGVNDLMQHVGADSYAEETNHIVRLFVGSSVQVVSVPRIRFNDRSLGVFLRLKSRIQRLIFDHGNSDPVLEYRAALTRRHPEIRVIDYDLFMPAFNSIRYAADGVHLTPDAFQHYGAFLAQQTNLSGR